jgi:NAD(P)-dependent dehydrogenase (short-subunit alcohol dehydrogenase family)
MGRVFITGSSTGLGLMAGQLLVEQGHDVVLHARNEARAKEARAALRRDVPVVIGDVSTIAAMRSVAEQANRSGRFDAVIHNVAVGYRERRTDTEDGLPHLFAINTLAPYVLTALIEKPARLVYLSSGMHRSADANLQDLTWKTRSWTGAQAYAESKLHNTLLAFAMARRWPDVPSNALEPGWVATRMGGPGAPDDLDQGHRTQVWLAVGDGPAARVNRRIFLSHAAARAEPERARQGAAGWIDRGLPEALGRGAAGLAAEQAGLRKPSAAATMRISHNKRRSGRGWRHDDTAKL